MTDRSPDVLEAVEKINDAGHWLAPVYWADDDGWMGMRIIGDDFMHVKISAAEILCEAKQIQEQEL